MKTIHVPLLIAIGWLALPAPVSAFYNPSTGRWLSRDPIAEKGGMNVNAFVGNAPVNVADADGRVMIESAPRRNGKSVSADDGFFKWTPWPLETRSGTRETGGGQTWETYDGGANKQPIKFEAPVSVVNCCAKVHVTSEWGARGWYDPRFPAHQPHEQHHYDLIRTAYNHFIRTVKQFDRKCLPEPQARCYAAVVPAIADAAFHESMYRNYDFDCQSYGRWCERADYEEKIVEASWNAVNVELGKCHLLFFRLFFPF